MLRYKNIRTNYYILKIKFCQALVLNGLTKTIIYEKTIRDHRFKRSLAA